MRPNKIPATKEYVLKQKIAEIFNSKTQRKTKTTELEALGFKTLMKNGDLELFHITAESLKLHGINAGDEFLLLKVEWSKAKNWTIYLEEVSAV